MQRVRMGAAGRPGPGRVSSATRILGRGAAAPCPSTARLNPKPVVPPVLELISASLAGRNLDPSYARQGLASVAFTHSPPPPSTAPAAPFPLPQSLPDDLPHPSPSAPPPAAPPSRDDPSTPATSHKRPRAQGSASEAPITPKKLATSQAKPLSPLQRAPSQAQHKVAPPAAGHQRPGAAQRTTDPTPIPNSNPTPTPAHKPVLAHASSSRTGSQDGGGSRSGASQSPNSGGGSQAEPRGQHSAKSRDGRSAGGGAARPGGGILRGVCLAISGIPNPR